MACEKSLEAPDSKLLEKVPFPKAFHSFGAGFKAKGLGHYDNQVPDFEGLAVPVDIPDEGPVDLQKIDRKAAEPGQRGISGPEIVDGDPDTPLLKDCHDSEGLHEGFA